MSAAVQYEQVDRRRRLSVNDFRREYLYPGRPVVIEDAIDDWKDDPTWSFDSLRRQCGTIRVRIFRYDADYEFRPDDVDFMELGRFIDNLLGGDLSTFPYYMRDNWQIFHEHAHLMEAHRVPPYFFDWFRLVPPALRMPYPRIFIGPRGAITPLHVDVWGTHAWLSQLAGEKRWLLYPPEQAQFLYGYKVRVEKPDLARHPLFRHARPLECTIRPGDTIFVPSRWSHWVESLQPGISLTYNYMGPGCFGVTLPQWLKAQSIGRLQGLLQRARGPQTQQAQ